jgi:hypothetical protein
MLLTIENTLYKKIKILYTFIKANKKTREEINNDKFQK